MKIKWNEKLLLMAIPPMLPQTFLKKLKRITKCVYS